VALVVAYHAFPQWLAGGFVGVDVFFVISGYLISSIVFQQMEAGRFSFAEFYGRRVRRIFPALLLVLATVYGLGQVLLLSQERRELFKHMAAGAGFVSNFVLWGEADYFDGVADTKPLLHLWSLAIEEQFYLAWPALLWLAWRVRKGVWPALLLLLAGSFALNLAGIRHDAVATFYSPQTRFWELLCGGALAWALRQPATAQGRGWPTGKVLCSAGLVLLGLAAWRLDAGHRYPGAWALLPVAAASALIAAGPQAWANRHLLSSRPLVWLGLLSYPLYLWHWPLLSLARIVAGETPSAEVRAAAVVAAFALAWLTWRWLERPLRQGGHGARKAMALSALMLVLGVGSYAGYRFKAVSAEESTLAAVSSQLGWQTQPGTPDQAGACRARFPERQPLTPVQRDDNFCLLAREGAAEVLMVGDSLGLSLFPGLSKHEGFNTLLLGASSAAPLYDTRTTEFDDGIRINNYRLTNHALDYALRDENVKVVVMVFLGGPNLARADSPYRITDIADPSDADARRVFTQALSRTLRKLHDKNKRVVYILPNPSLPYDVRGCVAAHRPFEPKVAKVCDEPAGAHLLRGGAAYRRWVAVVLKDFPQVTVFDAAGPVCDGARCWGFKDGQLLYRDKVHLSMDGSDRVAAELVPVIEAALRPVSPALAGTPAPGAHRGPP